MLVVALMCSSLSFSQKNMYRITKGSFSNWGSVYYYTDYQLQTILEEKENLKKNNVKLRTVTYYNKGEPYHATQTFNADGRLTQIIHFIHDKENSIDYSYDSKGNVVKIITTNSKHQKRTSTYTYNDKNKLLTRESYNFKGEYSGRKITYNKFDKVSQEEVYKKDKLNPVRSIVHTFYEGGEKKTSVYKEKGKVKYEWKYDCKPEGELLNVKQKDQATICIKEDVDADGNRIVWNREFNEKGELTKTKTVYKQDSIWVRTDTYNQNEILTQESYKTPNGQKRMSYKKGKVYSMSEFIYNDQKQLTKQLSSWKKSWNVSLYHYVNDLKISEVRVHKRSTYVEEINYEFY